VTTIFFWNRSVLGLIDSGKRTDDHPRDGHRSMMDGPEGVRRGAKSSNRMFLRDGHRRLAAAVRL